MNIYMLSELRACVCVCVCVCEWVSEWVSAWMRGGSGRQSDKYQGIIGKDRKRYGKMRTYAHRIP